MIGQRGSENARKNGPGAAVACNQHEGEQLRAVAHFGDRHGAKADEEGFHEDSRAGRRFNHEETRSARHQARVSSLVSPML